MIEIAADLPQVYLLPGEFHLARNVAILRTVLGSCVGISFWIPRLGIGALCHGVLPKCPRGITGNEGYRYVDFAIRDLARQFDESGASRGEVQVKAFGGGDVLPVLSGVSRRATVGTQNWKVALEVLQDEGFGLAARDLGEKVGRVIQFHTGTGEVLVRRLFLPAVEADLRIR